jgi:hypothetical protein
VLALRGCVHRHWPEIFQRYIWVPAETYPEQHGARLTSARAPG